jgi:glycosyltransferase involved in cell wall biosynthesis
VRIIILGSTDGLDFDGIGQVSMARGADKGCDSDLLQEGFSAIKPFLVHESFFQCSLRRMGGYHSSAHRVRVDGKSFRLDAKKFHPRGVTYGPFAPNSAGEPFADPERTRRDFELIRRLNANLIRVYHVPPRWLLDLADEFQLKLLVDIPWSKHLCFLDHPLPQQEACAAVRQAVEQCAGHPAVFAFSLVNEVPADIVRWSGARAVEDFIDLLIAEAKAIDPDCLCTFANYPPTEFLRPRQLDFLCYNVYLHHPQPFQNYLARLQMIADSKPLIIGEFGIDSLREGEAAKCRILAWQIELVFRSGLAGTILFSFTDDWYKDGRQVEGWNFGLTAADRELRPSYETVREGFLKAPYFPLPRYPLVSVVVACYNGAKTLKACLDSLLNLNYPNVEIILVDDGSTDSTPLIAQLYKTVRYERHINQGLSFARNTGIRVARGEIVAFTDADCRVDEDWLHYIVGDLLADGFVGMGGHNLLPPDDSPVAAAVMASPGGPAHVMLDDTLAEHIPGCNMVFYKWALEEILGFDPIFRLAGDDVDVCWRLQQRGYRIGFSSAGFVWHYRRSTLGAYLKQQRGYGEAEALLVRKHPENFNSIGASIWRGRIYAPAKLGILFRPAMIYRGPFGTGLFQTLYEAQPAAVLGFFISIEYHFGVTLPLLVLSVAFPPVLPLACAAILLTFGVCVLAGAQAELPVDKSRLWSKPLVGLLFFLQPIVRGFARYRGRIGVPNSPPESWTQHEALERLPRTTSLDQACYWSDVGIDRHTFLATVLRCLDQQGWQSKTDQGWNDYDVEIYGNRWSQCQITTVSEGILPGLVRCRLRPLMSLPAKLLLASFLAIELLVIGVMQTDFPWIWLVLLTLPILAWWLEQEKKDLQRLVAAFLDEVARGHRMQRMEWDAPRKRLIPLEGTSPTGC